MSALPEKLAKQFTYQRTVHAASGNPMDLFVSVNRLTALIAVQTRGDVKVIRPRVKAELERRVAAGELRRWVEVYGPSYRADRDDHYRLNAVPGVTAA